MGLASQYIATDLELRSDEDMSILVEELKARGLFGNQQQYNGWSANFGCADVKGASSSTLTYIRAIEKLNAEARAQFDRCTLRQVDIGFQAGVEPPFASKEVLPASLLKRAANLSLEIKITVYQFDGYAPPRGFFEWTSSKELEDPWCAGVLERERKTTVDHFARTAPARLRMVRRRLRKSNLNVLQLGLGEGETVAEFARAGHRVTALEMSPEKATRAKSLLERESLSADIRVGSLSTTDLGRGYDAVTIWSGFGLRDDAFQRKLLRMAADDWLLDENSRLFVTVFDPQWWLMQSPTVGMGTLDGTVVKSSYRQDASRYVLSWTERGKKEIRMSRGLRCYSVADFHLLVEGTGLRIHAIDSGEDEHTYLAVLAKAKL